MFLLDKLPFSKINNTELACIYKPNFNPDSFNEEIYTTVEELASKLNSVKYNYCGNISILHVNIRSLIKKFDILYQLINNLPVQPDLIAITETKLNKNSHLNFIQIKNYALMFILN